MLLTSKNNQQGYIARLTIAALGVVYGDMENGERKKGITISYQTRHG
jgi:hypothetical protein